MEKVNNAADVPQTVKDAVAAAGTPLERHNIMARHFGAPVIDPAAGAKPLIPTNAQVGNTAGTNSELQRRGPLSYEAVTLNEQFRKEMGALAKDTSLNENQRQAREREIRVKHFHALEAIADNRAPPPSSTSRTPPTPQELEGRNRAKLAEFDAEMRAKGIQQPAPDTSGAWSTPNADGSRTLTQAGQKMQADLLAEYNALPAAERGKAVTQRQYQEALYKTVANERGTVAAAHFMAKDLSGYQLPAGEYTPDVIHDLARARAIGLTQEQVERIIAAERA